jgi:stage III sporulation protein AA
LPYFLVDEIRKIGDAHGRIEEIRLRCDRQASLTTARGNFLIRSVLDRETMDRVMIAMCDGSLYAHRDTIAKGYLTLEGGIRVGIGGRASVEEKRVIGVYDVSVLNIRIPCPLREVGAPVCRLLREQREGRGVLIYSPPGEGKTTLLRSVAAQMASGDRPLRVVLVDTRGELGYALEDRELCLDCLVGYPRALGIEIATRSLNAQLIVCDEIGEVKEAEAIVAAQNCGVPFLASTHADSPEGVLRRTGLRQLHRARIFGAYVGIRRRLDGEFCYEVTDWEEADDFFQNCGGADARR